MGETADGGTYRDWPDDHNSHTIKVVVDTDEFVMESNENNNEKTISKSAPVIYVI